MTDDDNRVTPDSNKWKDNVKAQRRGDGVTEDKREELRRLRREVKELRTEREILEKASAFFRQNRKLS